VAGRGDIWIRRLLPRTRRSWAVAVLGVLTLFALDLLALRGSDLALDPLIFLSGMLAGLAADRLVTIPFRSRMGGSGLGRTVGLLAGIASVFVIIFGGTALAGIPPTPPLRAATWAT
jgi:hypothetical protein